MLFVEKNICIINFSINVNSIIGTALTAITPPIKDNAFNLSIMINI
jgi:hypothetical protein